MCLGVPGVIKEITNTEPLLRAGKVDFEGTAKEVNLSLVPDANIGDYVVVHAGFALSIIDEEEAKEISKLLFDQARSEDGAS
jgi:hydrogenase expression/formation protein HypC